MTQKITAVFGIAVLAAILLGGLTFSQSALAGNGQVTICHKPGTPAEQTKEVDSPAVAAHLAHGDTLGPCVNGIPLPDFLECFCSDGSIRQACITSCPGSDLCTSLCGGIALARCEPSSNVCTSND